MEKNILTDCKICGVGLLVRKDDALIIADLHLGIEDAMIASGAFMPRTNFLLIKQHLLEKIFYNQKKFSKIIINGDLKHEFGRISKQEWQEVNETLQFLQHHCDEIVLVQGNHDTIIGPLTKLHQLTIEKDGFLLKKSGIYITHGHKIPKSKQFENSKIVLIGHDHPAITISDGLKREKYKCFLKGNWKDKKLIVMPSLCMVSVGGDITSEKLLSPFLQNELSNFEIWVIEDKIYYFGYLAEMS